MFDRIIYFSDNQCNSFVRAWLRLNCCNQLVEEYRAKYNENLWVHAVDLQGYGTQQFCGDKFNVIGGWSEAVLPFIMLAERGISTLTKTIEEYDPDTQIKNPTDVGENGTNKGNAEESGMDEEDT